MISGAVQLLLLCAAIASLVYYAVCAVVAKRFFSRPSPGGRPPECPPVSLMIPLCGADFRAYDCYAAFCRQDYPVFQILFGVRDSLDTSVAVVEKLKADFPAVDIQLVVDSTSIGVNPKVDNLHNMAARARYDLFVLVDSDIRVGPDYLSKIAAELADERAGMVTCLYRAGAAPNLAARIEAVGITGEFAPGVLVADAFGGIRFAFGATIATTRENLCSIGGLEAVADYLADDYMLGNLIWRSGRKVVLSRYVVETMLQPMTFRTMLKHQVRWARGIRACQPAGHTGSVVTYGTALALLYVLASGASAGSLLLLAAAAAARIATGWYVGVRCMGDEISGRNLLLMPVRDLFSFGVWCLSLAGKRVEWRGKVFRIVERGKMKPAN